MQEPRCMCSHASINAACPTHGHSEDKPDQAEEVYDLTAYAALDMLLKATGLLPMSQITSRPVLHKAIDRCMEVLDRAVREGRYVVPPR